MKLFWTRVVNLLLIAAVLLVYQQWALQRARAADDLEQSAGGSAEQTMQGEGPYANGIRTGTGQGFGGETTVQVTVEHGWMTEIQIADTADDAEYIEKASALLDRIVQAQSADGVDAVSGATFSSNGILDAVRDAVGEQE